MFRCMRRVSQQLTDEEALSILQNGTSGVLALSGDGGYPYAVPLSYACDGQSIYFHCAKEGHKLDAIRRCPKASFCVIAQDDVVPEDYTTRYRSAIAFGTVRMIEDEKEMRDAAEKIALKYAPNDTIQHRAQFIERTWPRLCLLAMRIDHLTGKEGIGLTRCRKEARA